MEDDGSPQVSLYIYGDGLDPEGITIALGHAPTKAWRKGETKPSKLPQGGSIAATGLWMLRSESTSSAVPDHIAWLLARIANRSCKSLGELPGVEVAKIDVYLQVTGSGADNFEVFADQLLSLGLLGVGLDCTTDFFPRC